MDWNLFAPRGGANSVRLLLIYAGSPDCMSGLLVSELGELEGNGGEGGGEEQVEHRPEPALMSTVFHGFT